jgi:DNA-binding MarR family transcriptional regulator
MEDCKENIWKDWSNSKKSDLIHDFTMRNYDRANRHHDYGMGITCTTVEAHLLEKIFENPGITTTELAKRINRTKSAVSQIVARLEKKGLIYRIPQKNHIKKLSIYATEHGKELTKAHILYDEKAAGLFFKNLNEIFDDETMNNFFCVLYKFLQNMYPGYDDYQ